MKNVSDGLSHLTNFCSASKHTPCAFLVQKPRQNPSKHVATLAGGFNPFEKYLSNWESSPNSGENKEYFKPPPSYSTRLRHRNKWVASFQRCKLLPPIFFVFIPHWFFPPPPGKTQKKNPNMGMEFYHF